MPKRSRQLTEKGFDLLERNLCGKCKSGIRSATTFANKLGPLLQDENADIECIRSYLTELEQLVSAIVDSQICYDDKFADCPDILADFYKWFQPRFDTLSSVLSYTREFVSTYNVNMAESPLENVDNDFPPDNDIRPEDSVSRVSLSHGRRSVSWTSSSSKASSKASSHVSSIKSARITESLRKVSLLAESETLAKKQELMRKELELSLASESLELSTNLAVATTKRRFFWMLRLTASLIRLLVMAATSLWLGLLVSLTVWLMLIRWSQQVLTIVCLLGLTVCQLMLLVLPLAVLTHLSELVLVTQCQSVHQLMVLVLPLAVLFHPSELVLMI